VGANSLFDNFGLAIFIFLQVLTWHKTNHVGVLLRTRHTDRGILRIQYKGPPVRCVSVFEEGDSVRRTRYRLITGVSVDVGVFMDLHTNNTFLTRKVKHKNRKHENGLINHY
jgi:hypothetical protein